MTRFINSCKIECYYCSESTQVCIDWHHIDPSTKKFTIGKQRVKKISTLVNEMKKCECICSNCHRKLHNGLLEKPTKIRPRLRTLLAAVKPDPMRVD